MCSRCFAHFADGGTFAPHQRGYWNEWRVHDLTAHAYLFQVMNEFDFVSDEYLVAVQYATHIYYPRFPTNPASLFSAAISTQQRVDLGYFADVLPEHRQKSIVRCALADWLHGYTRYTRFSHVAAPVIDGAVGLAKVDGEVRVGHNGPSSMDEFWRRMQHHLDRHAHPVAGEAV